MNKKLILRLPIKPEDPSDVEDRAIKLQVNTLLDPYYISESSLLSIFVEEDEYVEYLPKTREVIFNASLRAKEFTYNKLHGFSEEHQLMLRRELALCFAINSFAKHFYKAYSGSTSRSKSFADFSVSTTVKSSPILLEDMISSSNGCILEAKKAIQDLTEIAGSLGLSNSKGKFNVSNAFSFRLWFHNNLPQRSNDILASNKIWYNGNLYKTGRN